MDDPVEVELKYSVTDPAALERRLERDWLGGLAAGPWRTVQMIDRHLDTADGAVRRAGFAARLRRTGDVTVISLKGAAVNGSGGALHRRPEIEGPASEALDPTAWPASEARERLIALTGARPLEVRFTLRQTRRERDLRGADGWAVLSLDAVGVEAAGQSLGDLRILEVESKGGSEAILAGVARELAAEPALAPETRTKAALADELLARAGLAEAPNPAARIGPRGARRARRAQRAAPAEPASPPERGAPSEPGPEPGARGVARGGRPPLEVGRTPGVLADDPLAEAGRKVLRFHFARLLAREGGTREGRNPEELHQMRVATRRMRAAWGVFGDAYRARPRRRYVAELRGIAGRLGDVRDLDVLLEGLDRYAAELGGEEQEALAPLRAAWVAERDGARRELLAAFDAPGYRRFLADYLAFVETPGDAARPVPAHAPTRVRETAGSRAWLAYEALRAYDATLRWADLATLHAARIAAKRLRYTLEAFRETLGPETGALIARVVALQDQLGALHDADVAGALAREFLTRHAARLPTASIEAVGRYLASREREVARLRRGLPSAWRPLVGASFRRGLGRAVSAL